MNFIRSDPVFRLIFEGWIQFQFFLTVNQQLLVSDVGQMLACTLVKGGENSPPTAKSPVHAPLDPDPYIEN